MVALEGEGAAGRWAAAESLADGVMDERMPERRRRLVWLLVAFLLMALVIGVVAGLSLPQDTTPERLDDDSPGARIAGLVVMGAGLAVGLGGFIWAKRTGRYIPRWRSVVSPLNAAERRLVGKQIRGKAPVQDRRLTVLRAVAVQTRKATLATIPLLGGMALLSVGQLVFFSPPLILALTFATGIVLLAVSCLLMVPGYRHAGAFLRQYPAQEVGTPSSEQKTT